jgi:hypothetical protein
VIYISYFLRFISRLESYRIRARSKFHIDTYWFFDFSYKNSCICPMVIARASDLYRVFVSFERFASRLAFTQPDNRVRQPVVSFSLRSELRCFISLTNKFGKANVLWFKKAILAYYKVPKTATMATMSSDSSPTSSTDDAAPRPLPPPGGHVEVVRAVIEAANGSGWCPSSYKIRFLRERPKTVVSSSYDAR